MTERRFNEAEVAAILEKAAEAQIAGRLTPVAASQSASDRDS
jgi:hypothetical protein